MKSYKRLHRDYTVVTNNIFKYDLSLKAIGLYLYIVNKPDGWNYSVSGVASQVMDGKDSIRSGIQELENAGFLYRDQLRKEDGTLGEGVWYVTDEPMSENPTSGVGIQVSTNEVSTNKDIYTSVNNSTSPKTTETRESTEIPKGLRSYKEQNAINKKRRALKAEHGGNIPPWLKATVAVPPSEPRVTITPDYQAYCDFISKDRGAIIRATSGGQKLWNILIAEGYKPADIKCASRIAYRVSDYWKNEFVPEVFFRRTNQEGKPVDQISKYMNYRSDGDPTITQIKNDWGKELGEL